MQRAGVLAAMGVIAATVMYAADIWESKPFTEWTDKEAQAVLSDSPWAGKGTLTNVRSGGSFSPVPDWKVTVAWRSARPIKEALVRQQIGPGGKLTAEQKAAIGFEEPSYIVQLEGLPSMYAGMIEAIGSQTQLLREGKPPLIAVQGAAHIFDKSGKEIEAPARGVSAPGPATPAVPGGAGGRGGRGGFGGGGFGAAPKDDGSRATLLFGFPRTDPITVADKEVEFSTTIGPYHLRRKFRVKDMVINGEPAL